MVMNSERSGNFPGLSLDEFWLRLDSWPASPAPLGGVIQFMLSECERKCKVVTTSVVQHSQGLGKLKRRILGQAELQMSVDRVVKAVGSTGRELCNKYSHEPQFKI